uniref:Uncharacterized protein n=1 Tax=Anopheles minimus TaxID=112268 RepID=A0A182WMT8_9DIPT
CFSSSKTQAQGVSFAVRLGHAVCTPVPEPLPNRKGRTFGCQCSLRSKQPSHRNVSLLCSCAVLFVGLSVKACFSNGFVRLFPKVNARVFDTWDLFGGGRYAFLHTRIIIPSYRLSRCSPAYSQQQ